jgi:dTDP-4-dehydrorhamnose 3,5-epimerase
MRRQEEISRQSAAATERAAARRLVSVKITPTKLAGVRLLEPTRHSDNRGWFFEGYRRSMLGTAGIGHHFVQDNHSYSAKRNTIRALRYQAPPYPQARLMRVLRGSILQVCVDARVSSATYGQHVALELNAQSGQSIYAPAGFLHGLCTLEDDTEVLYKLSSEQVSNAQDGIRWDDPDLAIDWPVAAADAIVSERDEGHPSWADFESPFTSEALG